MKNPTTSDEFVDFVRQGKFDFLDFGCGHGVSLAWADKVFGRKNGLGIDIRQAKIDAARAAGHAAINFDIKKIAAADLVQFTVLSHFLEHVPDMRDVAEFVRVACRVSKNFVIIKQPFFDADGALFQKGLKTFYADWTGHPNRMTTLHMFRLLKDLQDLDIIGEFSIHGRTPIKSSDDPRIHPVTAASDQHEFDPVKHPAKPTGLVFDFPLYYETVVFITMKGVDHQKPFRKINLDQTFVGNDGQFPLAAIA